MTAQNSPPSNTHHIMKIAFGAMALLCLSVGLVLYLFAESFGFDPDTARYVAIAFLIASVGDYIVLRFWDRFVYRR